MKGSKFARQEKLKLPLWWFPSSNSLMEFINNIVKYFCPNLGFKNVHSLLEMKPMLLQKYKICNFWCLIILSLVSVLGFYFLTYTVKYIRYIDSTKNWFWVYSGNIFGGPSTQKRFIRKCLYVLPALVSKPLDLF